jgi:hypothetical protein
VLSGRGASIAEEGSNPVGFGDLRYAGYTQGGRVVVVAASNSGAALKTPVTVYKGDKASSLRLAASGVHVYAAWELRGSNPAELMLSASGNRGAKESWSPLFDFGSATAAQISADGGNVHVAYVTGDGDVVVRNSADFGTTFSEPVLLGSGQEVVVTSNGLDVYAAWESTLNLERRLMLAASHDGGATFSIHRIANSGREPIFSLETGTGRLSLVYRADRDLEGFYLQSTDGGATWSAPIALDAPARQFMVSDAGGVIYVSYLKRFDIDGVPDWQMYLAASTDDGASFSSTQNLGGPSGLTRLRADNDRPFPYSDPQHFELTGIKGDGVYVWSGTLNQISEPIYLGPGVLASPWGGAIVWLAPGRVVTYAQCS